ncbi:hypothetical protein OSTOST_25709 [Ostertagia ostertagi]
MSFANALNSIDDIKQGFSAFGNVLQATTVFQKANAAATVVTTVAMKALGLGAETSAVGFKVLKGAIIATGIGALVIGLVALIQNFDAVKKAVLNLIPGLGGIATFIGNIIDKITDFVGITSEAGRAAEALIKQTEANIKKTEEFLDAAGYKYDQYTQSKIKANLDYQKHLVEITKDETKTEAEKQALLKQYRDKADFEIDKADADRNAKIKESVDKAIAEEKRKADEAARLKKEAAAKQKAIDDNIIAQDKITAKLILDANLAAIKDQSTKKFVQLGADKQAEIDASLEALNKKLINQETFNERKAAIDYRYRILEKDLAVEQAKATEEARLKAVEEARQKSLDAAADRVVSSEANVTKTVRENRIVTNENKGEGEQVDTVESATAKVNAIADAKRNAEQFAFEQELLQANGNAAQLEAANQNHQDKLSQIADEAATFRLEIKRREQEGQLALLSGIGSATSALAGVLGKSSVAGKAIGVANALINTYQGIAAGVKLGYPAAIPAVIAAAATGFGAVKSILSTKVPGTGDSGAGNVPSVPTAASLAPQVTAAQTLPQNVQDVRVTNTPTNEPVRAYIVDRDLQSNQQKSNFLNSVSSF